MLMQDLPALITEEGV
jgi:hypothetical protein